VSLDKESAVGTLTETVSDGVKAATKTEDIIIRPAAELLRLDFKEYYRYRHMLKALVWRNIRMQFDEMYLGVVWAVMRPLLYVFVLVAFRNLSSANTYVSIAYPLYVYSGLILWFYFLESTMETAGAVKADAHLMTKVYYPRLITPMVPTIANLLGLGLSLVPMLIMMMWYGIKPDWRLLLLPIVILQTIGMILGIGTMFASITLTNRDWERFLSFTLYIGLFISPVIYSPDMIPQTARDLYFLNPMAGTLLAFKSCFFGGYPFPLWQWIYSVAFSAVVFLLGVRMYRHAEAIFADKL
jgi:lipopolysaccharide transport system permease protein